MDKAGRVRDNESGYLRWARGPIPLAVRVFPAFVEVVDTVRNSSGWGQLVMVGTGLRSQDGLAEPITRAIPADRKHYD